jgi:cytochrome c oxidase subunit 4
MDAHASDDVSKHIKTYFMVFGTLMVLTIVTVAVSYLHLPVHQAIIVALFIATIKGSLVAMFFMHLNHERKVIYWVLMLTVVFFFVLMLVPLSTNLDKIVQKY